MYQIDFLDIAPLTKAGGKLQLPGSKSISNRALLMAALCQQPTTITNLLLAQDTQVMLQALRQLGCEIEQINTSVVIKTTLVNVNTPANLILDLANAGTAFRSLTAVLAVLGVKSQLTGVARMQQRPIGDLVAALQQIGCQIKYLANEDYPPLQILAKPQLPAVIKLQVKGDISSQYLTALLIALPLVAQQEISIEVIGELISKPYIAITLAMLHQFGIEVKQQNWQQFTIKAGANYQSPGNFNVEPDASSASYFAAIGALAAQDKPIEILGLGSNALQGDVKFIDVVQQMGAKVEWLDKSVRISRGDFPLKAVDLDCNHIPDAAMTIASLALFAKGTTVLRNIASWRVKETDRLTAMATELAKIGAKVEEGDDYLTVSAPVSWQAAELETYDDHRMAMCLSLLAFNPAHKIMRILQPSCVEKTFPDYFEQLFAVSQARQQDIPVICIDGPTASGKGTISKLLAQHLGYHYLDSGALYRLLAYAAMQQDLDCNNEADLVLLANKLQIVFNDEQIYLNGQCVTELIRGEQVGLLASQIAILSSVRQALLQAQQRFLTLPGLIADGRDMGTVVFPKAKLKIFLTASVKQRALRRFNQLKDKGISVTIDDLLSDLEERDRRDRQRKISPLQAATDAKLLDNSNLNVEQSVEWILQQWDKVVL